MEKTNSYAYVDGPQMQDGTACRSTDSRPLQGTRISTGGRGIYTEVELKAESIVVEMAVL